MKKLLERLLVVCAVCVMSTAYAVDANSLVGKVLSGNVSKAPLTESEVKAMPPACITIGMGRIDGMFWAEAMKKNKTEALLERPENAMAKDASWFHHYCWGRLSKLRSIYAKNEIKRKSEIKMWRNNMEFIIEWTNKQKVSWSYMPTIYTELAESFLIEKNYAQAIGAAEKSLNLKSDHSDAYWILSDSYAAVGNKIKALDAATEGLKYVPESKGLKRRYTALGGKQPYPTPYKANTATEVAVIGKDSAESVAVAPAVEPRLDSLEASVDATKSVSQPTTGTEPMANVPEKTEAPEKTNPYCRFCP